MKNKNPKTHILLIPIQILLVCSSLSMHGQKSNPNTNGISAAQLKEYLSVLAHDSLEGRETGQPGQKKAADFIAKKLKEFGVKPAVNDTGYFQKYPIMVQSKKITKIYSSNLKNTQTKMPYESSSFFAFYGLTPGELSAPMVFVNYGIKDNVYNDYNNIDVKNKVVMILETEPFLKDSVSPITNKKGKTQWSGTSAYRKKEEVAREYGAKALIIVADDYKALYEKHKHKTQHSSMRLIKDANTTTSIQQKIPVIFISEQMANELLKNNNKNINKIKASKKRFFKIKTNINVNIEVDEKEIYAENVAGIIEGSEKKEEIVVVSAHYDHLGTYDGKVFNGADDDGSGTVAMMNIAKVLSEEVKKGKKPIRSTLFLAFSGEEKGLLGSEHYSNNPLFPLENTVADLNIDMIGRIDNNHKNDSNYVYIIGSNKLSNELHEINEKANNDCCKLKLDYTYNDENDPNRYYYRSDHYNFAKHNVPVIFYFNGTHADYHKETEEIEKINFELMQKRSNLVYQTLNKIIYKKDRLIKDKIVTKKIKEK